MPWWLTIMAATCVIRLGVLPIFVAQQKRAVLWKQKMPAMQKLIQEMKELKQIADTTKDPEAMQRALKKFREVQQYRKENGMQLRYMFGPMMVQAPLFMSFFFALRHIADKFPDVATGGLLWFSNLAAMDPFYILPAAAGATIAAMGYMNTSDVGDMPNPFASSDDPERAALMRKMMRTFMMSMGLITPLATYHMPAAIFVYWLTNNSITLVQSYLFRLRRFRRLLGIVDADPAPKAPVVTPGAPTAKPLASAGWRQVPAGGFSPYKPRLPAAPTQFQNYAASNKPAAGKYQPASSVIGAGKKPN